VVASRRATTPPLAKTLPVPPQENLGWPASGKIVFNTIPVHPVNFRIPTRQIAKPPSKGFPVQILPFLTLQVRNGFNAKPKSKIEYIR